MKNLNTKPAFLFIYNVIFPWALLLFAGCKKFVDVPPPTNQLVSSTVFASDNTVISAVAGMYSNMNANFGNSYGVDISTMPENSADETSAFLPDPNYDQFRNNDISSSNQNISDFWRASYNLIYQANAIMAGIGNSRGNLSGRVSDQSVGEAKFIRAYCYFYLVNFYGNVPLIVNTDAVINSNAAAATSDQIYQQMISDLQDAQAKLPEDYSLSRAGIRNRANRYAATALLSRIYLYRKQWGLADQMATSVITKASLYTLPGTADIDKVFTLSSPEVIFQTNGSTSNTSTFYNGYTTYGATYLRPIAFGGQPFMVLGSGLVGSFETGDARFSNWIDTISVNGAIYYYPFKYKQTETNTTPAAEGYVHLRLAEQYLIRAEAKLEQGDLAAAAADLNTIRNRAGLANTLATTQAGLRTAVLAERRKELFCENGHRWFDLIRSGLAEQVLGAVKPRWRSTAVLYPIPRTELSNDPNLKQNPGY